MASFSESQIRITSVEVLPLDNTRPWMSPKFSPDGGRIYYTTEQSDGIWEYSIASKLSRNITNDGNSGGAFSLSADGNSISYRRTFYAQASRERTQEIILKDLRSGNTTLIASGRDLSVPTFVSSTVVYSTGKSIQNLSKTQAIGTLSVIGIENTKIVLNRDGVKMVFDPIKNGRYIWPSLSPDGKSIVAYEMAKGTFVCNVDGSNLLNLGRCDSPSWSHDSNWIVYMDDRDDGDRFISSDLVAVSPNGKQSVQLTFTKDVLEMNPQCSPTENKIVCDTFDGKIQLLTYEEEGK